MIPGEEITGELTGQTIKVIFKSAEAIAELHACLTSPRGDNFRLRLLQAMEIPLDETSGERFRVESGINEYRRHLNRLLRLGLAQLQESDGNRLYVRTELGEIGVNALREFERRVGTEAAQAAYSAALGPNSIRLFLRIYGDTREADWDHLQMTYTPAEIGRLSLFLPRTIEGLSAIDKLNEADLLVYRDDNHIHMLASKARAFYQYLRDLYQVTTDNAANHGIRDGDGTRSFAPSRPQRSEQARPASPRGRT